MDFLEDLFGDRGRRNTGGFFQNGDRHGHQDDDHDDDYDHRQPYPTNPSKAQVQANAETFPPGVVCGKCSTPTVQGAKFCHGCGTGIETIQNCASCGSKIPANGSFCPQCGYKN